MKFLLPVLVFTTVSPDSLTAGENSDRSKDPLPAASEAASRFHFGVSAGAAYRSLGDVRFSTGSRSGGLLAATWAAMVHYGREGYLAHAERIFSTAARMMAAVRSHPQLRIMGSPTFCFSFTSDEFESVVRPKGTGGTRQPKGTRCCCSEVEGLAMQHDRQGRPEGTEADGQERLRQRRRAQLGMLAPERGHRAQQGAVP